VVCRDGTRSGQRCGVEGKRKEKGKGRKEKEKGKEKMGKRKGKGEKGKKGKGKGKEKEEGVRKLGEILIKLEGRGKRDFVGSSGFSGVSMIFGTAVMERRSGRRDRGMHGIPDVVARVRALPAGFAARAPRVREGEDDRGFEGDN
jgi:hypothetical protein